MNLWAWFKASSLLNKFGVITGGIVTSFVVIGVAGQVQTRTPRTLPATEQEQAAEEQQTHNQNPEVLSASSSTENPLDEIAQSVGNVASSLVNNSSPSPNNTPNAPTPGTAGDTATPRIPRSGSSVPSPSPPRLIMSPDVIILGNNSGPVPQLYMSNGIEISEPNSLYGSPDISISWYTCRAFGPCFGHYAPGPYYVGYMPLIIRVSNDRDGEMQFPITVQDRAGNSYSTTLKLIWFAERHLWLEAGGLDKRIEGDNVVFTGHVLFKPTPNVGTPEVHLKSYGAVNFGANDICNVSWTDVVFTFTGQTSYDITCALTLDRLNEYPNGFETYAWAEVKWPLLDARIYSTKFHAN